MSKFIVEKWSFYHYEQCILWQSYLILVFSIFWMNKEKKIQIVYPSHKLKAHDIITEHLAILNPLHGSIQLNIYTHLKPHQRQQIQVQLHSFMYHVFERLIRMIHLNNS